LVSLLPAACGGYTLLKYRTLGERLVAYFNVIAGIAWLFLAWDSNIKYAFQ
jgi:hypothetical protein